VSAFNSMDRLRNGNQRRGCGTKRKASSVHCNPGYPIDKIDNRWQSIPIDINQSMNIDNRWQIDGEHSCGYRLVSIINTNRCIDWQQLVVDGRKRTRQIKNTTLYAMIVNTFHFNVNSRTILSSFSWTLTPRLKRLFHGPIYRLQKTESVRIVPSQKNSGHRSCTFANNEIANNSSMSYIQQTLYADVLHRRYDTERQWRASG